MKTRKHIATGAFALALAGGAAAIELRFAMPEFTEGYGLPDLFTPPPNSGLGAWDILTLFGALSLATWLVFKKRSRRGLFLLSIASMVYFGFYRTGCICPVGSTQNVAAAIFLPGVGVSITVLLFFLLPLLFALFFGRVFCAAVCPLGAIQELVAISPIRISRAVDKTLGLGKHIYLGVAILGVATGAGFLICRYDPFVGLYRMGHSFNMLLAGGVILLLGVFIARPYCRFLCPYGVLLGWMSKFSKWHLDIAPTKCVSCRLCEDSCPYNAIDMPTPEAAYEPRPIGVRRIRRYMMLAPFIVLVGAVAGALMNEPLARLHPKVTLSERIAAEDQGIYTEEIQESEAFRAGGQTVEELHAEAAALRGAFRVGGALLGGFLALMVALRLISLAVLETRDVFTPDRENCFSCGRCYPYCPVEEESKTA